MYNFWATQNSSRHRSDQISFYASKASEHINIINNLSYSAENIVDIGTGFGEILEHYLLSKLPVTVAQDFNVKALQAAKERCAYLQSDSCIFTNLSIQEVLSKPYLDTVIASASVNQYCNFDELNKFFNEVSSVNTVKHIIFFDCIDPLLYLSCLPYSSFKKRALMIRPIFRIMKELKVLFGKTIKYMQVIFKKIIFKRSKAVYLGKIGMGFGYFPFDMVNLANLHDFDVYFRASIFYEYRYHCIFTKRS